MKRDEGRGEALCTESCSGASQGMVEAEQRGRQASEVVAAPVKVTTTTVVPEGGDPPDPKEL